MAGSTKRVIVQYRGHVQGVGFRVNAIQSAQGLAVDGFVRNEPDGSVLMDVQGPTTAVDTLMARIQDSMSLKIEETLVDPREMVDARPGFKIRY